MPKHYRQPRQPGGRRADEAAIGRALARKTDQTEVRKLIVEAIAAAFGAGAAIGWIVNAIHTHRPSRQNTSSYAELVISLLPDEADSLRESGELSEAARLVIVVTTDTRRQPRR